jgi:GMP synthase (glutamine-hydrolysing)
MPDLSGLLGGVPVLGICYGAQLLAQTHGGRVAASNSREYGRAHLMTLHDTDPLLEGMRERGPAAYQEVIDTYFRHLGRDIPQ